MSCAICSKTIRNDDVYMELDCQEHLAHGAHRQHACPVAACRQRIDGHVAIPTLDELYAKLQRFKNSDGPINDDNVHDQNPERSARISRMAERVDEPLEPFQPSLVGAGLRVIGRLVEHAKPDTESSDPLVLLQAQIPLSELVSKHGFDITELINDHGVTIREFFGNGYHMGEMCSAFASRLNAREGHNVLRCLGVTDAYFRDLPEFMQISVMQRQLGYHPEWLLNYFEYKFTPGEWTLSQMINSGLTMPLVMQAGMRTKQEWQQLRATATGPDQLKWFGATPALEAQLEDTTVAIAATVYQQQQPAYHGYTPAAPQQQQYLFANALTVSPPARPAAVVAVNAAPVQQPFPRYTAVAASPSMIVPPPPPSMQASVSSKCLTEAPRLVERVASVQLVIRK